MVIGAVVAALSAPLALAGVAAASPASSSSAAPRKAAQTAVMSGFVGRVVRVDGAAGRVVVVHAGREYSIGIPAGTLLVHEVPEAVSALRPGMTIFAQLRNDGGRLTALSIRAMTLSPMSSKTTSRAFSVAPAQRLLLLATDQYGPKTVVLVPTGAGLCMNGTLVSGTLSVIRAGSNITVTGQVDTADDTTILVRNAAGCS
jgi:hypothetical protein